VFVAVLDSSSLVAAARRLHRSPPWVTRALSALEVRLGARLIERTTHKLTPTEIDGRIATDARRALAAYAEAIRPRGLLRITAPLIFGRRHVTRVVASLLDLHPAMRAELVLADGYMDLLDEGLDVALRIGPSAEFLPRRIASVRCGGSLWRRRPTSPRTARRANRRSSPAMQWCTWSDGRFHPSGAFALAAATK